MIFCQNFICKKIFDPGAMSAWTAVTFSFWLYFCGVLLLSSCTSGHYGEPPSPPAFKITKEDSRFAAMRCQQNLAVTDGTNDTLNAANHKLRSLWNKYTFPNDTQTHCYVKCYLSKLGLIDLHTRGLSADRLDDVWKRHKADFSCLNSVFLHEPLDGRCISYYEKFMLLRQTCLRIAQITFAEYRPMYELDWKPFGATAMDYCNSAVARTHTSCVSCSSKAKHRSAILTDEMLVCIFKHFRYFDAYGRLDEKEILLSFSEAQLSTLTNVEHVKRCTHLGNSKLVLNFESHANMARTFDSCLKNATKDYADVLTSRNKQTRFY